MLLMRRRALPKATEVLGQPTSEALAHKQQKPRCPQGGRSPRPRAVEAPAKRDGGAGRLINGGGPCPKAAEALTVPKRRVPQNQSVGTTTFA